MKRTKAGGFMMAVLLLMGWAVPAAHGQRIKHTHTDMYLMTSHPIMIETASLLPEGMVAIDAGLVFESDREWLRRSYDNIRLAPIGLRYGVTPYFELGGLFGYSINDEDDRGAPDESGFEGLSLFGKLELNKYASLRVGLTFGGDEDIAPYPNDEIDLFGNLALHRRVGQGLLYGEFGYTTQGGDLDRSEYFNYGIGYSHPVAHAVSVNAELAGEEEHAGTTANTLDLVLGVNVLAMDHLRLAPFVTFGLNDASPDFSFGSFLELRF